jgi:hypothetical protein
MKNLTRNYQIIVMRQDGLTLHQIAEKMEVSRQRVHQILKANGISGKEAINHRLDNYKRIVEEEWAKGFNVQEIHRAHGIGLSHINRYRGEKDVTWKLARLKRNAEFMDGHWIWKGKLDAFGYGHHGRMTTHRYVWELLHGKTELDVCHSCERPDCFNPAHLYAGHPETGKGHKKYGRA